MPEYYDDILAGSVSLLGAAISILALLPVFWGLVKERGGGFFAQADAKQTINATLLIIMIEGIALSLSALTAFAALRFALCQVWVQTIVTSVFVITVIGVGVAIGALYALARKLLA